MKLYLVRHAIAESAAASDAERALTEEGKDKMRRAAQGLRAIDVSLDLLLTSPLRRARETAEILAETLRAQVRVLEELASGADPRLVLGALRPYHDRSALALVGHEPDLGKLASVLLAGSPTTCPLPFKKGGVACFDGELLPGTQRVELEWFLTPKQLRTLA
ncbi:MAG: phosphohistidine phosphatase SixA [Candidatus Binatia bacterium]